MEQKMVFVCTTRWEHSGVRSYDQDERYELTAQQVEELIALDKQKPTGALEYFEPLNESARKFCAELQKEKPAKEKKSGEKRETQGE